MTGSAQVDFLLTISSILLGLIGLYLAFRFRRKRIVTCSFPMRQKIFSNKFGNLDNFKLLLNEEPVRDLFSVQVKIVNKGNETLFPKDFLQPMTLSFDRSVKVFPVNIKRKKGDIPTSYEITNSHNETNLILNTDLFEPKDTILIDLVYENDSYANYVLDGRIIDGKIVYRPHYEESIDENYHYRIYRKYKGLRKFVSLFLLMGILTLFIVPLKIFFPEYFSEDVPSQIQTYKSILSFVLIIFLMFPSMWFADKIFDHREKREIKEMEEFQKSREKWNDAMGTNPHSNKGSKKNNE